MTTRVSYLKERIEKMKYEKIKKAIDEKKWYRIAFEFGHISWNKEEYSKS